MFFCEKCKFFITRFVFEILRNCKQGHGVNNNYFLIRVKYDVGKLKTVIFVHNKNRTERKMSSGHNNGFLRDRYENKIFGQELRFLLTRNE